jgi:threonyl-tRNA synthetase
MIHITFPDGKVREYPKGTTAMEIAESISSGLARNVLSARVNGKIWDATRPITTDATLALLTWTDKDGKSTFWHSSAHLLAEALEALYPGVKFGIGPSIDSGFYYDVDLGERTLSVDDLPAIEQKMLELAREKNTYDRREVSKAEALAYFEEKGDEYKLELISELEDGTITFYQQGDFVDPFPGHLKRCLLQLGKQDVVNVDLDECRLEVCPLDFGCQHEVCWRRGWVFVTGYG